MTQALTSVAALRAVVDFRLSKIEVPEWSGAVFVRSLPAGRWDRLMGLMKPRESGQAVPFVAIAEVAAIGLCDEAGAFLVNDGDDWRWILDRSKDVVDRIAVAVLEVSGVTKSAVATEKKD